MLRLLLHFLQLRAINCCFLGTSGVLAMAQQAGLGSRAERRAIADDIERYLDTKGMARKDLIRPYLSKSSVEKLFQGDFTDRTLSKVEGILNRTFARSAPKPERNSTALKKFGGYSFETVEFLQGDYLCIRPLFNNPTKLNVYSISLSWNDNDGLLTFVEKGRADAKYSQKGIVYIPFGTPFMNLVSNDVGALRSILLSLPDEDGLSRGIISTLSNPKANVLIPAASPIVLKRLQGDATPDTGIVGVEHASYDEYHGLLAAVMAEEYGLFAMPQQAAERRKSIAVVNS
jgi:hypothetical protein